MLLLGHKLADENERPGLGVFGGLYVPELGVCIYASPVVSFDLVKGGKERQQRGGQDFYGQGSTGH